MGTEEDAYVMGSSRGRRLPMVFVLLAVVVAMVVVAIGVALGGGARAVAAPAATDATIEATTIFVGPNSIREGYAVCPGTKRAIGGGVVQSGTSNLLYVNASGPLDSTGFTNQTSDGDKAKQWYAAVQNLHSSTTRVFRVFAICSGSSDATIEATEVDVRPGNTGEGYAVCPGTKRALGGGVVQYGPADDLAVNASGPLDSTGFTKATVDGDTAKQWYAAVQNRHSSTTTRTFRVFAICSGSSDAGIRASSFTVNHNKTGEADAVCPGNMRALGGGVVEIGSPKRLHVRASGPLDSTGITNNTEDGDIARQWYAAVANFSAELRTFKVFAICE